MKKSVRNYNQPTFYHFSQDSIILAKFMRDNADKNHTSVLEIGAGCGVISFELIDYGMRFESIVCVEIQPEFQDSFNQNKIEFGSNQQIDLIISDFVNWQPYRRFDLIYFNPPYYLHGHGRESSNKNTQICRSIEVDLFKKWLIKARALLASNGELFFCLNQAAIKNLQPLIDEVFDDKCKQVQIDNCVIYYLVDSE